MTTTTASSAIVVDDVRKTYPTGRGKPPVHALDGLSFAADAGAVFGLLGPNGAGKSTTVKILATLARPDAGRATVAGIDAVAHPDQVRRVIGYVAQKPVTDPMDTGRENLVLAARLQGMSSRGAAKRAEELLERFGLTEAASRLVRTYSGGMARKLDVAMGIVHRPHVLFLDEPTTGLDPEARAQMWGEIERLTGDEQMSVLLTTHYLEEADRLARRLAIVDRGRVVAAGTPDELKDELHGDTIIIHLVDGEIADLDLIRSLDGIRDVVGDGRTVRARAFAGAAALPALLAALDDHGIRVASATVARPSLDDVYLRYTGRTFAAAEQSPGEPADADAEGRAA